MLGCMRGVCASAFGLALCVLVAGLSEGSQPRGIGMRFDKRTASTAFSGMEMLPQFRAF
jgi:hypothetical protein